MNQNIPSQTSAPLMTTVSQSQDYITNVQFMQALANQQRQINNIPTGTSFGVILVILLIIIGMAALGYYVYYEEGLMQAAIAAGITKAATGALVSGGASMTVGQMLKSGTSTNKLAAAGVTLQLMTTGQLTLTAADGVTVIMQTPMANGVGPYTLELDSGSGDLIVYDANRVKRWNAGVISHSMPTTLSLLSGDGSAVITDSGKTGVLWSSTPNKWIEGQNNINMLTDPTMTYAEYTTTNVQKFGLHPMVMQPPLYLAPSDSSYMTVVGDDGSVTLQDAFNKVVWTNNVSGGTGPYTLEIRPFHLQVYDSTRKIIWDQTYGDASVETVTGVLAFNGSPMVFALYDSQMQHTWWAPSPNIPAPVQTNQVTLNSSVAGSLISGPPASLFSY